MKKILLVILLTIAISLSGCNKKEVIFDKNFDLPEFEQTNEEVDTVSDYLNKIHTLINKIENHEVYPYSWMTNLIGDYYSNRNLGVTKDNLELTSQITYYHTLASGTALMAVETMENDYYGSTFIEDEEFTYDSNQYKVIVNENYLEFTISNEEGISSYLRLLVEDDNIIFEYYFKNGNSTHYIKNDYKRGYLHVNMSESEYDGNDYYSYMFFNYNSLVQEKLKITNSGIEYTVKDIMNGEYISVRTNKNYTIIDIDLLDEDYVELGFRESRNNDEVVYSIRYNLMNMSNWDSYLFGKIYQDGEKVLTNYNVIYYVGIDPVIEQYLDRFNENDFNSLEGSNYTGPITYQDIQDLKDKAESVLQDYYVSFQSDPELIIYVIEGEEYTFDEARELFVSLIYLP